ncbi:toll/interleukin-1 receptor domain-containing protein [Lentzea sp. NEAU-D7]|uniref:toll/interleukin-1 receptor domain-containing protein n=1 Tax=Lentzea sp. NEAU-D7 TaxID=2994667 RepID=UPI00224B1FC4|nr:toll/interleukin-1 receptor domain-containing protein [Lentzea sp. NEAU-D7]MCX2950741.1 toll/interleukin-1 receptor domain-containing protein [Lentzea sp. NEAU-D7]
MVKKFNASAFQAQLRAAQRKAEQDFKRKVSHAQNKITQEARRIDQQNQKVVDDYNHKVAAHNRAAEQHNRKVVADINRSLQASSSRPSVRYTVHERQLVDRVHEAVAGLDNREYDAFLSYARIDGAQVATELRENLAELGASVWFDEIAIIPGKSLALQMDSGLRRAKSGIALLTPAYLTGRFWTQRELGALLHKNTLIPVLHNVTFEDVAEYSGILPDLAGFTTANDSVRDIAVKIASAILPNADVA